jgi:hypothetical protein
VLELGESLFTGERLVLQVQFSASSNISKIFRMIKLQITSIKAFRAQSTKHKALRASIAKVAQNQK